MPPEHQNRTTVMVFRTRNLRLRPGPVQGNGPAVNCRTTDVHRLEANAESGETSDAAIILARPSVRHRWKGDTMRIASFALALLALFSRTATGQATIEVVKTDFEQGVDYGVNWIEPVATADVKCPIGKWKKTINWDYPAGTFEELLQPVENHRLFSRKVFSKTGDHQVVAKAWVHCQDSADEWTYVVDSLPAKTIHVWPRVPIKTAGFSAPSLTGGQPASLHLRLGAPAPRSGTRVSLTSSDPALLPLRGLPVDNTGPFVMVAPGKTEATVELQTGSVTSAKSVRVRAATGSAVTATLKLLP